MVYIIGNKLKIEWHNVCKACSSILFKVEAGGLDKISVGEISRWDGLFIVRNLTSSHLFHLVTWKFSTLIFSAAFFFLFGIIYLYISVPKDSSGRPCPGPSVTCFLPSVRKPSRGYFVSRLSSMPSSSRLNPSCNIITLNMLLYANKKLKRYIELYLALRVKYV